MAENTNFQNLWKDKKSCTHKEADDLRNEIFGLLIEEMKKGNKVKVKDFGVFFVKESKERKGRNPATGQEIMIPPKRKIVFRPASQLKALFPPPEGAKKVVKAPKPAKK